MRITLRKNKNTKIVDEESLRQKEPEMYKAFSVPVFNAKQFIDEMEFNPTAEEYIVDSKILTDSMMDYCDVRLEPKCNTPRKAG